PRRRRSGGKLQHRGLDARLDVAEGDRQGGIGVPLEDAEARGEFGQRRERVRLDRERERIGVDRRARGVVLEPGGNLEREACLLREWTLERDGEDGPPLLAP